MLTNYLNKSGDHPLFFDGQIGAIEAVLTVPAQLNSKYIALLGHPHSLQGGTMNNKVVTTMARAFKELGIASVRFNFRGVGETVGTYDHGVGESADMLTIARQIQQEIPTMQFLFTGFSFGSYVAYRAAAQFEHVSLITIAPPVHHYDYMEFSPQPSPWGIIQGDNDEVVPLQLVQEFALQTTPPLMLKRFPETGHFFHGQLIALKACMVDIVNAQVAL